jgi:AraC-like DNA-binding protein
MISAKNGLCYSFGEAVYAGGDSYAFAARSVLLLAVWEGSAIVQADGADHPLTEGQCGLFLGRPLLNVLYPVMARVSWCEAHLLVLASRADGASIPAASDLDTSERIATLLRLGTQPAAANPASATRLRNAIGEAVMSVYIAEVENGVRTDTDIPDAVAKARDYVDRHFAEPCDLALLSKFAGVSREHLISEFRKHLGITPVRYLWVVRTKKAAVLIRRTRLSLAEVADCCGYKSHYHLSREIKRMTGKSPRDLRNMPPVPGDVNENGLCHIASGIR